jgi:hypothetical protein
VSSVSCVFALLVSESAFVGSLAHLFLLGGGVVDIDIVLFVGASSSLCTRALLSGACFLLSRSAVDVSKYVISSKSTDVITGLRAFFKESSAFDPSSRSALVLKCIQQEMIFPCVTTLRKEIYETLPYQDVRGTWKIIVLIGNTSLTVRHKKRERSRSVEDSEYFEFEWELDLKFNPELTAFTSSSYPCE